MSHSVALRPHAWRGLREGAWCVRRMADHPDLIPVVANWLWDAFWQPGGHRLDELCAILAEANAQIGPPQSFVLLAGDVPCGTASFMAADLEIGNDLGPWLAGVYVVPEARGQGCAQRLIAAVEQAARRAGEKALYLHTNDAQGLYESLGWRRVKEGLDEGRAVTIMRRDL